VISYSFWQRRFGGAMDAIGRTMVLDDVPFTIVGVTPPAFFGLEVGREFDVAVPLSDEPLLRGREDLLDHREQTWLTIMVKLRPAQSVDAATAGLRGVQSQIREATLPDPAKGPPHYLDRYLKEAFALVPSATGTSVLRRRFEQPLQVVMVVVAFVLLIACANIANLSLARATARHHELCVRQALGASRWRLVRQLLTESVVLASIGMACAIPIASWGSRLLVRQLSTQANTVFLDLSIDGHVLMFTMGITVATMLLFGAAPALRGAGVAPVDALKAPGHVTSEHGRIGRLASSLIIAQVALSVVLVMAASLFVRTFSSLATRPLGFERDRVLVVTMSAQRATVDPAQRLLLYERAREAVRTLPGVAAAALSPITPVSGNSFTPRIEVSGGMALPDSERVTFGNLISPGWFRTFGTPLIAGRDIIDRDRKGTPPVAVVNQEFARKFLAGASPLGHTITLALNGPTADPPIEIVGVAADAVYRSLRDPVPPTMYLPLAQHDGDQAFLVPLASASLSVQSTLGPPGLLTKSIAAAIGVVNPELTLTFRPLADQVDASLTQERLVAMLSGFFGALALLLAGLGLYGVTAYAVSRRRTEIGIRMALGAEPAAVVRLVLSRVVILVGIGAVIGSGLSLWASKFVASLLYGLAPRDPMTLIVAVATLAAVGVAAGWLPARRASRIDPAAVLRES
jgi:putative ABC transport system permease protein